MNTFQIFEQFRGPLGEEAAKALAQTLGAMFAELKDSVTKEDFRILREASDANFARIDSVLERLVEAQARTEARLGSLAEAQAQTEARLGSLTEAQAQAETGLDSLAQAQARTEQSLQELTAVVRGLVIRTDRHEGDLLELRFQRRLPSYLGLYLRRAKVLQPADILNEVEAKLDRPEVEDYLRADVLAQGLVGDQPTYVIGEVSYTADADDVERAARRAALLRKADLPAVGLVACESVHPQTIAYAREQGVRVWAGGCFVDEKDGDSGAGNAAC